MTPPRTDYGFDDDGRPVQTTSFTDPFRDEPGAPAMRAEIEMATARATAAAIVGFIVPPRRDPLTAGRRALALAWVCGALPGVTTQKQLAALLRCSAPQTYRVIQRARFSLWRNRNSRREA